MKESSPQLEDGHLRIANELVEELAKKNIPGAEMRIIWAIWRKTWCWKDGDKRKNEDWISITQFEKATGLKRANVHKAIKSLLCKRIIVVMQKDNGKLYYRFNKHYTEWLLCKRIMLCKSIRSVMQKHNKTVMQKHKHKEQRTTIQKKKGDFLIFWKASPIRKGKEAARKAFEKVDVPVEVLLSALEAQEKERKEQADRGDFVPNWKYPATWLNQRCWEDEPAPVPEKGDDFYINEIKKMGPHKFARKYDTALTNKYINQCMNE